MARNTHNLAAVERSWYGYFQLGDDVLKIGARVIKTGIAVAITMFICKLLDLEPAFFRGGISGYQYAAVYFFEFPGDEGSYISPYFRGIGRL